MNINETINSTVATIEDVITGTEATRFRSSLLIDLAEGMPYQAAVNRAFRSLWSHRIGYASTMSDGAWVDLNFIAERLGVKL
jgi:hypothetical protein